MPEDAQAALFELTHQTLQDAGWGAYEVSNFASAPTHRSRHNLKYWRHVPYLGLGPSAHSFDGRTRWWNFRDPARYERHVRDRQRPVEDQETLSDRELALETLMLGLRTTTGIGLEAFHECYGLDLIARNEALVERLLTERFLRLEEGYLVPTVRGLAVADGLASRFQIEPSMGVRHGTLSTRTREAFHDSRGDVVTR